MRFFSTLLLLPAVAAAQQQVPLLDQVQGWIEKAKSLLPSAAPAAEAPVEPVVTGKGTGKVTNKEVTAFNIENWASSLAPVAPGSSKGPQDWLVFVTGGNKTCFGRCEKAEKAWNVSIWSALWSNVILTPYLHLGIRGTVCGRPNFAASRLPQL
jgi:hypothetical protein